MAFLEVSFAEYMVTGRVRKTVTILPLISGIDIQLPMRRFGGNRRNTFYAATVLHHRAQRTNVSLQEWQICNVRISCHYRCYGVAYCMFDRGVLPVIRVCLTKNPKCPSSFFSHLFGHLC